MEIKINAHGCKLPQAFENGDWIDLASSVEVAMNKGEFRIIPLGVSMKLPDGYEAHVVPRSSTFKTWGLLQTNSMGVIDNSYCGDDDVWCFPAYATRDTVIHAGDRICQFRVVPKMDSIKFIEVEHLGGENRGGFGTSGRN